MSILFEHIRCPLHCYTFSVRPIRERVERACAGRVLNLFAGQTKLALDEYRNDLDPDMRADSHCDALDFLRGYQGEKFGTILLDPPYAYRKSMELCKAIVCSPFRQLKDEIPLHLQPSGCVITFGYHSVVMGKGRGFKLEQLAVFSHGGAIRSPAWNVLTRPNGLVFSLDSPFREPATTGKQRPHIKKRIHHEQQHLYH